MKVEDYFKFNIHKKINIIFPFFKSKHLCKRGMHNFRIEQTKMVFDEPIVQEDDYIYNIKLKTKVKCFSCGKEEYLDE